MLAGNTGHQAICPCVCRLLYRIEVKAARFMEPKIRIASVFSCRIWHVCLPLINSVLLPSRGSRAYASIGPIYESPGGSTPKGA